MWNQIRRSRKNATQVRKNSVQTFGRKKNRGKFPKKKFKKKLTKKILKKFNPKKFKKFFKPIEEKFAKRVAPENGLKYFMLNSLETITKTSSSLICEVYLEMLISQKEKNLLSRAIDEIYFSGISISCNFVLSLFQDDEMLFPKGRSNENGRFKMTDC